MTLEEMILLLCEQYKESTKNERGGYNIRVKTLGEWISHNLPFDDYSVVFGKIISEFKPTSTVTFPMIPHLQEIFFPEDKDEATLAATLIINALQKYWNPWNPKATDKIMGSVGPLGWEVISLYGGWARMGKMLDDGDINVLRAQLRDCACALRRRAARGIKDLPALTSNFKEDFKAITNNGGR